MGGGDVISDQLAICILFYQPEPFRQHLLTLSRNEFQLEMSIPYKSIYMILTAIIHTLCLYHCLTTYDIVSTVIRH